MHFDVTIVRAWPSAVLLIFICCLVASADGALKRNGKIAFVCVQDGDPEICVIDPDGTNQIRLTFDPGSDSYPKWSPDGTRIAFAKVNPTTTSYYDLFTMAANGTNVTQIRQNLGWPFSGVSWSPDGRRMAFVDDQYAYDFPMIYSLNADGSNYGLISPFFECCATSPPSWSRHTSKIAYVREVAVDTFSIFTIRSDGSDHQLLVPTGDCGSHFNFPTWSPNGDKILFSALNNLHPVLMIADADGSNCESITGLGNTIRGLDWSPDGRKAVLNIGNQIFTVNRDGSGLTLLADGESPSWQGVPKNAPFDFDGDGYSDVSVFRPSDGTWYRWESARGFSATRFGLPNDRPVPADYDGDRETDIAIFRNGEWWVLRSSDSTVVSLNFGLPGDLPVPADYTGDGQDKIAVYRNGQWWIYDLSTGQASVAHFGVSTDRPVPGDFDGDGRIDQAVYRNGEWHLNRSSDGYAVVAFGLPADQPIVGDYDGDGKADLAVYRGGTWYLMKSTEGFTAFQWGVSTDIPVPADYDGDGRTDGAIFRGGTWWILGSSGSVRVQQFGLAGDKPIPATGSF